MGSRDTAFAALPAELVVAIFFQVVIDDNAKNPAILSLMKVCRHWHDISQDPSLWTVINLGLKPEGLRRFLRRSCDLPVHLKAVESERFSYLQDHTEATANSLKVNMEGQLHRIFHISIQATSPTTVKSVWALLRSGEMTSLRHLDMKFVADWDYDWFRDLELPTEVLPALTFLVVENINFKAQTAQYRGLTELSLNRVALNAEVFYDICDACPGLERLKLQTARQYLTDQWLENWEGRSRTLPRLAKL